MRGTLDRPVVWLGQSVDTSSLCSSYPELQDGNFLTSLGCAIRRPSLVKTHFNEGLRRKLGVTGPLMLDSGGFALLNNPQARWTASTVAKLIDEVSADVYVSLDVPPLASDTDSDRRGKIVRSFRNCRYLKDRFHQKIIMPVVHGRTDREINYSIELLARLNRQPSWVGLGGIVPLLQHRFLSGDVLKIGAEIFIATALLKIKRAFPKAKIHAFGAGGTRTFPAVAHFGADSSDSIGWRQAAGYGSIFLPLKSQRVIVWGKASSPPRKLLNDADRNWLASCVCPACKDRGSIQLRIKTLRQSFEKRSIHNAWTLRTQYEFWPKTNSDFERLISEGGLGPNWARALEKSTTTGQH
jgi:queuine/archaeosine tRNA-ribosyltransferase